MSTQAKPAATTPSSQTSRPSMTGGMGQAGQMAIPHDRIAKRAYEKWCQRGCPQGTHQQDWYEAEAEICAEITGQASRPGATMPPMQQPARPAQPQQQAQPTSMPQKAPQRR